MHISQRNSEGQIAQLVEQRIENPCVGGSIPPLATKTNRLRRLFFCPLPRIISHFSRSSETSSTGSAERNVQTTFPLLYESFQLIHHQNISMYKDRLNCSVRQRQPCLLYSGLNLNQDKATKPQTVQIVRQGEATPYWFKVNPLCFLTKNKHSYPILISFQRSPKHPLILL